MYPQLQNEPALESQVPIFLFFFNINARIEIFNWKSKLAKEVPKGQSIVFKSSKKTMIFFPGFLP